MVRYKEVNYNMVCEMIIVKVKLDGERRVRDVVNEVGKYLGLCLDSVRIMKMLKGRGCIVEKEIMDGDVLRIEDWVV